VNGAALGSICPVRGASAAHGNAVTAVPIKLPERLSSIGNPQLGKSPAA